MVAMIEFIRNFFKWIDSKIPRPVQQTSRTIGNNISRAVTTLFEKFPALKPGARVPKLRILAPASKKEDYPLLHDRYILGRDRRICDIIVPHSIVSSEHLSIERRHSLPDKPFVIQDRGSRHGIYQGKQQIKREIVLKHGDVFTLGQPVLKDAIKIKFIYPHLCIFGQLFIAYMQCFLCPFSLSF